ncbi:MAG TPA: STAS domain-containing protein [Jatrophihabitantaceae bacterium]|jgi:anti-anti-sigma factor|nr:STAS domain-containing protein [Jatrophihabitantaceae bacterium]
MSLSVGTERNGASVSGAGFDVRTLRCDATRANVRVSGDLDADGAAVLAQVIDSHLRAGRRFLRLHIGGVRSMSEDAVATVAAAHDRLLGRRGTMILTGVSESMEAILRAATPASPLLLVSPTAAEQLS